MGRGIDVRGSDALLAVDVMRTFMPGGALPVPDGDAVLEPIERVLPAFAGAHVFAAQDWHPPGHVSFASSHPGRAPFDEVEVVRGGSTLRQALWPDHALAGSDEAAIASRALADRADAVVRKGTRRDVDSYSAFLEADRATSTGLAGMMRARGVTRVLACGLATDFCVAWSVRDALDAGFAVVLLTDACRGIATGGALDAVVADLVARGAATAATGELRAGPG